MAKKKIRRRRAGSSRLTRGSQDQAFKERVEVARKRTESRRPSKRMSHPTMRKLLSGLGADAQLLFWFDGPKDWVIDGGGTFRRKDRASWPTDCFWIEHIVNGTSLYAETEEDDSASNLEFVVEGCEEQFGTLAGIYAIEIIFPGRAPAKEVRLSSISQTLKFDGGDESVSVGCKTLDRKDADKAFKALGEWLGYEFPDG